MLFLFKVCFCVLICFWNYWDYMYNDGWLFCYWWYRYFVRGYLYGILVFIVIWYDGIRDGCIVCIIMIIELFLLFIICLFNVDLYVEFGNIIFWV